MIIEFFPECTYTSYLTNDVKSTVSFIWTVHKMKCCTGPWKSTQTLGAEKHHFHDKKSTNC